MRKEWVLYLSDYIPLGLLVIRDMDLLFQAFTGKGLTALLLWQPGDMPCGAGRRTLICTVNSHSSRSTFLGRPGLTGKGDHNRAWPRPGRIVYDARQRSPLSPSAAIEWLKHLQLNTRRSANACSSTNAKHKQTYTLTLEDSLHAHINIHVCMHRLTQARVCTERQTDRQTNR